jgi:DNA-binding response OmpR family regulator
MTRARSGLSPEDGLVAPRPIGYKATMPQGPSRFRVLLVDDEPVIRELVRTILEGEYVEVRCVGDGVKALTEARAFEPHLVLLDVVLPGMDGFSVCRLLRADPLVRRASVHMLTAKTRLADRESGRRAGADGYIEKPFKAAALQELVAALRQQHGRNRA